MATEVMNGPVMNGVAGDIPSSKLANGVAEMNGHDDGIHEDAGKPDQLANGDVPHLADASAEASHEGSDGATTKGLLGVSPVPPPQGEVPAFGEVPLTQPQEAPEAKVVKRYEFFLVKVPRPDTTAENTRIQVLQMTIAEKKEKTNFFNAALRLKQAARSEAQVALRAARDRARACSAEVRKKFDEAKPLQDILRRLNDGRKDARAQGKGLEATTEAELNALIAAKEHHMQHERITLNEEKQLMKDIKLLEASRPKVREMQAVYATVHESMGQKDTIQAQLKPLLAEVDLLKVERDAAQEICKTFEAEAEVCEKAVQDLLGERAAANQEQDVLWEELRALKAQAYRKEEEFRQFRRDLGHVQQLAMGKNIGELETFCQEQRERMHGKLNKDAAYRKAYVAANTVSTIRRFGTPDTRRLGIDEDPATLLDPNSVRTTQPAQQQQRASTTTTTTAKAVPAEKKPKEAVTKAAPKAPADKAAAAPKPTPKASTHDSEAAGGGAAAEPEVVDAAAAKAKEEAEAEREVRRQEAVQKAKEAEERKRKLAERAQQRAEAKAAKDAEEAAKRREKEKERKARKKAAAALEKAAADAAAEEAAEEEAEAEEEGADEHEHDGEGGAAPASKESAKKSSSTKKKSKQAAASEALTKRQRKRLAATKPREEGEGEAKGGIKKKGSKEGGAGAMVYVGAAVAVLVLLALVLLGAKVLNSSNPVFAE